MTSSTDQGPDLRKSAALARERISPRPGSRLLSTFGPVREVLRNGSELLQAGFGHEDISHGDPQFASVFFLDGEPHRRRRTAISRYFTPKAIKTRHLAVMQDTTDRLLAKLQAEGSGLLDDISFELAVAVAGEIVGLTDKPIEGVSRRINAAMHGTKLPALSRRMRPFGTVRAAGGAGWFFVRDVRPAIARRRSQPGEDVISHLVEEGYPSKAIFMECLTYAGAGMVTTREFIVMAAWHLFDDLSLRQDFVSGDEQRQTDILEELLRLEPVASMLYRRAESETTLSGGVVAPGELIALSLREANVDEATVGACPYMVDPERAARAGVVGSFLSFGDGTHRCPGAQVAMTETRVLLDRLFQLPGIRLDHAPTMTWNPSLESYELRDARVSCDRAASAAAE